MEINIRKAIKADLESIAACHLMCFPKSLGSKLGKKFMMDALRPYLVDENKCIFIAHENNICIGYISCKLRDGSLGSASVMIQSGFKEGIRSFISKPWLLFHPEMMNKLSLVLKNISRKILNTETEKTIIYDNVPTVGLPGVCVSPAYQGKGLAKQLIHAAEVEAILMGYEKLRLTVSKQNLPAIRAYEYAHFVIVAENKDSYKMEKYI